MEKRVEEKSLRMKTVDNVVRIGEILVINMFSFSHDVSTLSQTIHTISTT